jgi:hypothetical protein
MKCYFYTFKNPTGRRASVREFITRQTCKICDYKVDYMCPTKTSKSPHAFAMCSIRTTCTCQKLKFSILLLEYCKIRECYAVANAFTIRNMHSLFLKLSSRISLQNQLFCLCRLPAVNCQKKKKDKRTNNDLQNITQKTKDRATRPHLKPGSNSGSPGGFDVPWSIYGLFSIKHLKLLIKSIFVIVLLYIIRS